MATRTKRRSTLGAVEIGQQRASEIVVADGADHRRAHAGPRRRDRLVAALAAAFRVPGMAGHRLALARAVGGVDHDVVVQAAEDSDERRCRRRHEPRSFRFDVTADMVRPRLRSAAW